MSRQLRARVWVRDDLGVMQLLVPGQDVPDWAVGKIRNPAAWADDEPAPQSAPAASTPASPAASPGPAPSDTAAAAGPPPRSGKGSSRAAWADYAALIGVEVPDGADRDHIISAVETAGHAV